MPELKVAKLKATQPKFKMPPPQENKRPIITEYYRDWDATQKIKSIHSKWANRAVPNCLYHMSLNHYGALLAQVHDTLTGDLHAVMIFHPENGEITTLFQREVKEGM